LVAGVAAVANHDDRGARKCESHLGRLAAPCDEPYAPRFEGSAHVCETLEHEAVVPQARLRITLREPEADDERQHCSVRQLHRVFQRIVVRGALRLLHPIQHVAPAAAWRAFVQRRDAGRVRVVRDSCHRLGAF
jgi:hypothetical protein